MWGSHHGMDLDMDANIEAISSPYGGSLSSVVAGMARAPNRPASVALARADRHNDAMAKQPAA